MRSFAVVTNELVSVTNSPIIENKLKMSVIIHDIGITMVGIDDAPRRIEKKLKKSILCVMDNLFLRSKNGNYL